MLAVPADTPVTTPRAFTVATAASALLHVPPPIVSENNVVAAWHTVPVPVMVPASAGGLTVTTVVAAAAPQPLVTV